MKGAKQIAKEKISYCDKKFYIGIDVHKEAYSMTCICEKVMVKKATMSADPTDLGKSLVKWFKNAQLYSAYEAGFSGFGLHRTLESLGIKSIVFNAASIAVAANDKVKTDSRDSKKIAEQLAAKQLTGIYIPTEKEEARRTLTRTKIMTFPKPQPTEKPLRKIKG